MKLLSWLPVVLLPIAVAAQGAQSAPTTLPAAAAGKLDASLEAARRHTAHVWRDTSPINADGTINAYVEIAKGDLRKWEFNIATNARAIDRMIPEKVGGYPINYGYVPQTISYDGDPFDILVLGPPIEGGSMLRGRPVGVMFMEDEKGLDSKIVVTPLDAGGKPLYQLTDAIQREVGDYFGRYKQFEPGAFSRVPGWGTRDEGVALVRLTHEFFLRCRARSGSPCTVAAK